MILRGKNNPFTAVLRIRDVLSRIRGVKKPRILDPTYFCIKAINKFCLLIPDPDPTIAPSRIRGVKKHRIPDPDLQHCFTDARAVFYSWEFLLD
jgi:hypothetical protein